ncbi:hypothetical protein [uncultured Gemmiger sp.]|uniref:hypothetical protein n=1 Tax=uncultured Gemmiger sp. TaxID=1623490 RepID=UPI0025FF48F4|nr:hypothetical protein [uncultured Gemmiger sp.]
MRKLMRSLLPRLAALLGAVLLLAGCAPRSLTRSSAAGRSPLDWPQADSGSRDSSSSDGGKFWDGWDGFWDGSSGSGSPARGTTAEQRRYGSAALLAWPSVLVSVYLDEADGASWDEEAIAESRDTLATAVDWIGEQCARYNVDAHITCDDGSADSGLFYHLTYNGSFAGGTDSAESDDFYTAAYDFCARLDTQELHDRYGTSNVGFLLFLPVDGASFTIVHYMEDGADYYHEFSCLYRYDAYTAPDAAETPAVYAHEILHLFGAPDLYEGSTDYYVTPDLTAYVEETWPEEIMLDTYGPGGSMVYGGIDKEIGPLTAYRLGLCTEFEGMDRFPQVTELPAGAFSARTPSGDVRLPDGAVAARPGA